MPPDNFVSDHTKMTPRLDINECSRSALARCVAAAAVVVMAGCASGPLSFVEGVPLSRTDSSLYPVRIVAVDGSMHFDGPGEPVQLSPGPRHLVLEAAPSRSVRKTVLKSFILQIEPCRRYYLAAKRQSSMDADWTLVEDRKEVVAGCDEAEELRKAELLAKASAGGAR